MIEIKFLERAGKLVSFNVKGHADYAEYGSDIVCSAVSAVAQTVIIGITEVLKFNVNFIADDGDIAIDLTSLQMSELDKCQVLMEATLLGLKSMEISYGDYIKVGLEEV